MKKADCLEYAARCRAAADKATERAALYAVRFGSADGVTARELAEVERANDAARRWDELALTHHQTRAKLLRDGSLPASMFGFAPVTPTDAPAPAPAKRRRVFRLPLHSVKLTRTRSARDGAVLRGLWESAVVRMEAVEGGWEFQCPMRRIGLTHFYEFAPPTHGGQWQTIGILRTLDHCCMTAERLQSGTHVLRSAYRDEHGPWPRMVVEWTKAAPLIAADPSVCPPGDTK